MISKSFLDIIQYTQFDGAAEAINQDDLSLKRMWIVEYILSIHRMIARFV